MQGARPTKPAIAGALGDSAPGLYAVIGALSALHQRDRTGEGAYIDISMYDRMIAVADIVHPASMGSEPSRVLDGIGILHAFRAADGWFTIEVVREQHFPRFAEAVGHPEWITDPRLKTRAGWSAHMDDVIRPGVERWAATRTKLEAATGLARNGVAAGPVNTAADIAADPHVQAREFVHEFGAIRVVGNPIGFGYPTRPWPTIGEHTDEILRERLSLSTDQIDELRDEGVIS